MLAVFLAMALQRRAILMPVIPGRAEGASPESITPKGAVVYYVCTVANRNMERYTWA